MRTLPLATAWISSEAMSSRSTADAADRRAAAPGRACQLETSLRVPSSLDDDERVGPSVLRHVGVAVGVAVAAVELDPRAPPDLRERRRGGQRGVDGGLERDRLPRRGGRADGQRKHDREDGDRRCGRYRTPPVPRATRATTPVGAAHRIEQVVARCRCGCPVGVLGERLRRARE